MMLVAIALLGAGATSATMPPLDAYATCLLRRHERETLTALDSGFDEPFAAAVAAIPIEGCAVDGLRPTPVELRGPLFAAAYRRAYARSAPWPSHGVKNGWTPNATGGDPRLAWYGVSDCLLGMSSANARSLVLARPGGVEADKHFEAIVRALPKCLLAGGPVRINRAVLTGIVAETAFRADYPRQLNGRHYQ